MTGRAAIAAIVPQFFSTDIAATLAWYDRHLGFETQFEYGDPASYAGAIRDGLSIFFRHMDTPPAAPADKMEQEYLDAYLRVEGVEEIYQDIQTRDTPVIRKLTKTPWGFREFVVRDCDGRLLCFGELASDPD